MRGGNGQCGFLDAALIEAARAGKDLDEGKAALARVIEYEAPNRGGDGKAELIALITTRTDPRTQPRPAARARIPRKVGARDRRRPAQNPPDRSGPGQVHPHRPHRPPGRRPGLSPLTTRTASAPRSWPASVPTGASTRAGGAGPTRVSSSEPAITPTW